MKTIKGPAVFLAQFVDKSEPFNSLDGMCKWASELGYKGIQIPTWESSLIDLDKERSIDVIITRLRKKVEENPKSPKYLQTIRGEGYVLWIE